MYNKMTAAYFGIVLMLTVVIMRLFYISINEVYVCAAQSQSRYSLTLSKTRGTIYDCKMRPLAGQKSEYKAVILSGRTPLEVLEQNLDDDTYQSVLQRVGKNYPFAITVNDGTMSKQGVNIYKTSKRYFSRNLAPHTVGYLDSSGTVGISGIERVFNDYLSACSGQYRVVCPVDGTGKILDGCTPEIDDTTDNSVGGVVLTLDADIQQIAQNAAEKYIEQGAVVIMEIPGGKLRALVSRPDFSLLDVKDAVANSDSALVNRCLAQYDVGSVFKLVTAAAALEAGVSEEWQFECTGSLTIGQNTFTCSGNKAHGMLDMQGAISNSCNLYFITLAQEIGAQRLLSTAQFFGFGDSMIFAPGYESYSGNLPDYKTLQNPAALANFSFGQGELMATPVQITAMIGAIADDGVMPVPQLVERTVDKFKNTVDTYLTAGTKQVINQATAQKLQVFMHTAVENGTAKPGKSELITSGAKTGTAETGIKKDGKRVLQAGYAGFFPYENPKYVCVVLVENGKGGGVSAGPVFREIAEKMTDYVDNID
ncbi:MAG: penicillin-binding protein 2 [Clostridia bacterium]|nr:penicillin-binding protein 2 [Clostridia bacterium]